jgi:luciferase family oxidoreductase group 1
MPVIPLLGSGLSPISQGSDAAQAFRNSLDLAQQAERWNYKRFWLAEHHNMPGIASAATAVVIGYIAGGTRTIRVRSGGVMLPNNLPLVIAEQFGTLGSLYRGRIDLGLGRAPGADQRAARASENFPHDVMELEALLGPLQPDQVVRAVPGAGLRVPIWLLGSSTFSAQLAAMLGLPFAFASHFAPSELMRALDVYRAAFSRRNSFPSLTRWLAPMSSSPIPMPRRGVSSHRWTGIRQPATRHARTLGPSADILATIGCFHRLNIPDQAAQPV